MILKKNKNKEFVKRRKKKIKVKLLKSRSKSENTKQQSYLIANLMSSAFTVFLPAWRAKLTAF